MEGGPAPGADSEQQVSPLAARPYDLRHAAVSLWLNPRCPAVARQHPNAPVFVSSDVTIASLAAVTRTADITQRITATPHCRRNGIAGTKDCKTLAEPHRVSGKL
ncbi:hypothetical protein GCM10017600_05840 [Streptosporangium carneum]|uniref:Uncharacterized protein n=1 Tax=Streptosporangium carneum TaxID=47481 RepID=A0A9W6MAD0_9ACTN|nr:hypothetical protein GCM10017600_05840 [Streptosporangium carneum]